MFIWSSVYCMIALPLRLPHPKLPEDMLATDIASYGGNGGKWLKMAENGERWRQMAAKRLKIALIWRVYIDTVLIKADFGRN